MNKDELISKLSEILSDNAEIIFSTITWFDEDGTHNWDSDSNDVT